ncbi:prepilin-type N-terminal cleavage/methylation domain-containing protein [Rickettsiales endosymbiont of Stachyamoeba lipophora]|uniref:prepilin-type N-terminal cleavage/methylation domain-containing protein n=1 Tax=Rickettsiales endosymbiont of Stachyamoeba lipophora TaxID=2486578 RepID=UPI0013DDC3DD|nr:prepilin-type N-terminal cleavage/methylation domain-containing protein [Rickettsiales endosymbiont of Stachyamoeba lipophora]
MTQQKLIHKKSLKAFTLVELAIVLVIIGLIIGGVLAGQDLIRQAEISATVRQMQSFSTATATFRTKYNAFPGDMVYDLAASFGFNTTNMNGATGFRDGNYILTDNTGGYGAQGENLLFWRDLRDAQLISELTDAGAVDYSSITASNTTALNSYLPAAKLGRNNYFIVYGDTVTGMNYIQIARILGIAGSSYTSFAVGINSTQAYNIDLKLDDGRPNTGIVTAYIGTAPNNTPTTTSAGLCASATTNTATYISNISDAGVPTCSLKIRMD